MSQYSESTLKKVDSLKYIIDTTVIDTIKAQAYLELGFKLYPKNIDTLIPYSDSARQIADENLKRKDLSERENYTFNRISSDALSNIGYAHIKRDDYKTGLDLYFESLRIRELIGYKRGLSNSYNNIAGVYNSMNEPQKALDYYMKSLEIRTELEEVKNIALSHNNIGYTYQQMDRSDSALWHYEKSYEIYLAEDNMIGQARTLTNLGTVYRANKEFDKALDYFERGMEIRRRNNYESGLVYSLQNIANLYIEMGNYSKAKIYAFECKELIDKSPRISWSKKIAHTLYQIYRHEGNYKKSLEMYEEFVELKDSLRDKELEKELIRNEYSYQYQQQAREDSLKAAEQQKVNEALLTAEKAENEKRKQQSYFLYGVIALVLIFGGFILNRFLLTRKQKRQFEDQKILVEEKNNEIVDSINYAKGIQEAILPPSERMKSLLGDHFVLYKPKDIVAGDFYWADQIGEHIIYAAADCTGHGVPGAMVSVVCHNALHRCIHEFGLSSPDEILNKTRDLVIETFETTAREVKDGMDIALCAINKSKMTLQYAGANNNLYLIRKGEMIEYKADKQPVGKHPNQQSFSKQEIKLEKGDLIYVFTDGYPDQFGGEKGKKFKYKNLKNLLMGMHQHPLSEQQSKLDATFEQWKGDMEQLDDVCVIGVRVHPSP